MTALYGRVGNTIRYFPHRLFGMMHSLRFLVVLISLAVAGCSEPEDTGPGRPVAHRRDAFHAILDAFEPIGSSLRAGKYAPDKFIAMAQRLNEVKDGPWQYFTPNSDYPPTRATDRVWSEPEKFEAGHQAFLKAVGQFADAAATRDEAKVRAAYETLHETCRDCHKAFRK